MTYKDLIDYYADLNSDDDSDYIMVDNDSDIISVSDYDSCSCADSSQDADTIATLSEDDIETEYECNCSDHDGFVCDKYIPEYIKEMEEDELQNHQYFIDDSDLIVEREVKHIGELFK